MKKILTISCVLIAALSFRAFADASCSEHGGGAAMGKESGGCCGGMMKVHHGGGEPHGMMFLNFADELGLSDSQVSKLNKLRLDTEEKMWKLQSDMMEQNAQFGKLSHEKKVDTKKLNAVADKIGSLKAEEMKLRYSSYASAKATLNDKQRAKLDEIFTKYHGTMNPSDQDDASSP